MELTNVSTLIERLMRMIRGAGPRLGRNLGLRTSRVCYYPVIA